MQQLEIPKEFDHGLVKQILSTTALEPYPNSEIEIRLKSFTQKKGVTQSFFVHTIAFLNTFTQWEQIKEVASIDYYYGDNLRTTHVVHGEVTERKTIQKKRVAARDIHVHGSTNISTVRISHTIEEPVPAQQLVDLSLVRKKQRTSYIYKGWSYDLTKVWEGPEAADVKSRYLTAPPDTYEIEVEKIDSEFQSLDYLIVSLLLKAISLLRPSTIRLS